MLLNTKLLQTILQSIHPECSVESIAALPHHFTLQELKRTTPVLRQGEIWKDILLVHSGIIRMHFLRADGREFNKNFFAENSILCPLTPTMWSSPSLFGISAIENTQVWRCPIEIFINTLKPNEWQAIQRELLIRLLDSKLQREHDLLALNGRQRYTQLCENQPHLIERVPLLHLATYLGMTDVSLSRLRNGK